MIELAVPDALLAPRPLPKPIGWDTLPANPAARLAGDDRLAAAKHAAVAVPSVIVPEETNYLLSPVVPGFERIQVLESHPFTLDSRLRA